MGCDDGKEERGNTGGVEECLYLLVSAFGGFNRWPWNLGVI